MKCLLCEFECKFFISSRSCNEMLEHAWEIHSKIVGDIDIRQRDNYCSFKGCKDKKI